VTEYDAFPWESILGIMLGQLRISPQDLWAMSMPELRAVLKAVTHGPGRPVAPMKRDELTELMSQFPDLYHES